MKKVGNHCTSGTLKPSRWYANRHNFYFLHKKYIHRYSFYFSGSVNESLYVCVAYFPCLFFKMAIIISYSHFDHVAFVSILVLQTFDRMMFGRLSFPETRWYVVIVQDPQIVRDQKKFGNHCFITINMSVVASRRLCSDVSSSIRFWF